MRQDFQGSAQITAGVRHIPHLQSANPKPLHRAVMIGVERESPFRIGGRFLIVTQFPVNRAAAVPRFGKFGIFVDHSIQDGQRALELLFFHGFMGLFKKAVRVLARLMEPNVFERAPTQFARGRLFRMQHAQEFWLTFEPGEGHRGMKLFLGIRREQLMDEPLFVPGGAM